MVHHNILYTKLHFEIEQFIESAERVSTKRNHYKEELINEIKNIVAEHCPCFDVCLYGSYSTGLSLASGDIDVVLVPNENYANSSMRYEDPLERLSGVLD